MKNSASIQDYLMQVSKHDINYLLTLDYIDLKNLCSSNRELLPICEDNIILRQIIYKRNNDINIDSNFDIVGILNDTYSALQKIIDDNFTRKDLPRWINEELFNDDMLRTLLYEFIDKLSFIIEDNDGYISDIDKVELFSPVVAFPLISYNVDISNADSATSDVPSTVKIPKRFYEYINPTIRNLAKYISYPESQGGYYEISYHKIYVALEDLFLASRHH